MERKPRLIRLGRKAFKRYGGNQKQVRRGRISRNTTHQNHAFMSEKNRPKYSFSRKLGGGEFLNVAVWPGRSNPEEEVVSVQLRKFDGEWKTLARVALYRTKDGAYSELPERTSAKTEGV